MDDLLKQLELMTARFDLHIARMVKLAAELEAIMASIKRDDDAEVSDL